MRCRRNLILVSNVCATKPICWFWAPNGLNELAEFPFNLISKSTMAFFTRHLWLLLKSCYTSWGPEQGFDAVFQMDLARSRRTVHRTEKLAILSFKRETGRCCFLLHYGIVLWTRNKKGGGWLAVMFGTEFNERFFRWLKRGREGNWANFVPRNSPTVQFDTKSTQCQENAPNNQNLRTLVNNIFTIN